MFSRVNSVEFQFDSNTSMESDYTVGSSLSSLYKQYAVHIKILKLTGIVTLVSMVAVTLAITTNIYTLEHRRNGTDLTIQPPVTVNNSSLCHFIKQFALPDHYFVTVCLYQNEIRLDIPLFINGRPTIKGVYLTIKQFDFLKRLLPHLHKEIINDRNLKL